MKTNKLLLWAFVYITLLRKWRSNLANRRGKKKKTKTENRQSPPPPRQLSKTCPSVLGFSSLSLLSVCVCLNLWSFWINSEYSHHQTANFHTVEHTISLHNSRHRLQDPHTNFKKKKKKKKSLCYRFGSDCTAGWDWSWWTSCSSSSTRLLSWLLIFFFFFLGQNQKHLNQSKQIKKIIPVINT